MIILISLSACRYIAGQTYYDYINLANNAYENKLYKEAGKYFSKAFSANYNRGLQTDKYNAACSWALANQKTLAFHYLRQILGKKQIIPG